MSDWELMDKNCSINNENETLPFANSRLNRELNETCSNVEVDDIILDDATKFQNTQMIIKE